MPDFLKVKLKRREKKTHIKKILPSWMLVHATTQVPKDCFKSATEVPLVYWSTKQIRLKGIVIVEDYCASG